MGSVNLIKFLDKYIGSFLCLVLSAFAKERKADTPKEILFIQLWGIGETILTVPAIKAVQSKYPKAKVKVLATSRNKEVFESTGIKSELISLNPFSLTAYIIKKHKKYDIVIDLEEYLNISSIIAYFTGKSRIGFSHGIRSKLYNKTAPYNDNKHAMESFMNLSKVIGAKGKSLSKLQYSAKDKKKVKSILGKLPKKKNIVIVAGAAESAKSRIWPYFKELGSSLDKKYNLIYIGAPSEREMIEGIISKNGLNLAGKTTLKELFCLIDMLDLVITNDTGPLHMASAQNTPTIALFGPNLPKRFGPLVKKSVALYNPKSCRFSPCINVHKGEVPDCLPQMKNKGNYQKCMKSISLDEVLKEIKIMRI